MSSLIHARRNDQSPAPRENEDLTALWEQLRADAISASDRAEIDEVFSRYAA